MEKRVLLCWLNWMFEMCVSLIIRTFLQPKRRKDIYILAHLYYDNIYRADIRGGKKKGCIKMVEPIYPRLC